jgi:hypothetical protein
MCFGNYSDLDLNRYVFSNILTGEIEVEVTGVVGVSPALWYFRYIASIFLTTQSPVGRVGMYGNDYNEKTYLFKSRSE